MGFYMHNKWNLWLHGGSGQACDFVWAIGINSYCGPNFICITYGNFYNSIELGRLCMIVNFKWLYSILNLDISHVDCMLGMSDGLYWIANENLIRYHIWAVVWDLKLGVWSGQMVWVGSLVEIVYVEWFLNGPCTCIKLEYIASNLDIIVLAATYVIRSGQKHLVVRVAWDHFSSSFQIWQT